MLILLHKFWQGLIAAALLDQPNRGLGATGGWCAIGIAGFRPARPEGRQDAGATR